MLAIQRKHGVEIIIQDGDETEFKFQAIFGVIQTSIRSLQHIWSAACFFGSLYCERQKAMERGESEVQLTGNPDVEVVRILYEMSCKAFEESKPMTWPPDIGLVTPNLEYLELADEIFRLMCSFAILHEIGHFELGHNKIPDEEEFQGEQKDEHTIELEADKWAYDWSLSSWKDYGSDPRIFTKRTFGVIFALAMAEEFHFLTKSNLVSSHPRAYDRLHQFYDDYEQEIDDNEWGTTCFNAVSIGLQMVAINNKRPLPIGPYYGIRGFLEAVRAQAENRPEIPTPTIPG